MSKIQEAFPANGRELFESEKPVVEAFNKKYGGNMITKEELAQVQEMQKAVGFREDPFPRRFDPCDAAVIKERKAILKYLGKSVSWEILMDIEEGKHLAQS